MADSVPAYTFFPFGLKQHPVVPGYESHPYNARSVLERKLVPTGMGMCSTVWKDRASAMERVEYSSVKMMRSWGQLGGENLTTRAGLQESDLMDVEPVERTARGWEDRWSQTNTLPSLRTLWFSKLT